MKKTNKISNTQKHIVILGGGLAGLAASYELSRNKYQVTVIEEQEEVGGLARTIEKNGFRFDTGPHRWYTKNDMVNTWMLKLMGSEVIQIPRLTRIYFDKKFFYYPIKFQNVVLNIGFLKATRAVVDYFWVRFLSRLTTKKAITLEEGYIEKFGKTLYETFFKRYSEKLWGRPCSQVSADWIGQRTRGFNIATILKDMFFKSKGVVSFVDEFSYPKKGIGRIAEKLAQETQKMGGVIYCNTQVKKIISKNKIITGVEVVHKGKKRTIKGDYFISSIPLSDAVFFLHPKPLNRVEKLAKKLSYRDELQVTLFINKTHVTPDTWIYVHPKELSFMRVMEMTNWGEELSPKGKTSLVFEIACNEGDSLWRKSDQMLIEMVSDEFVNEFGLVTKENILGGYVHRMLKEYPIYHVGYREDVDEIKKYLQPYTNLQLVGRNGTFRYNNMDHSIEMGLYAAWNIIKGKNSFDIESVNIEREYLEEKQIELVEDEYVEEEQH